MNRLTWLTFAFLLVSACSLPDHSTTSRVVSTFDDPYLAGMDGAPKEAQISYAYIDSQGNMLHARDAQVVMHAASLMKVAVMVEVFRQIDAGTFTLEDKIPVTNSFRSVIDGSTYSVTRDDDSDDVVHTWVGGMATVEDLLEHMITRSSNLATNVLLEAVTAASVQSTLRGLGITMMEVRRGVEDGKAFAAGVNNVTTAHDMARLFVSIAQNRAASRASCDRMIGILSRQTFRAGIPRGIPLGSRVANKTGSITRHAHDVALIIPKDSPMYVLAVLTRGFDRGEDAEAAIARVAATIAKIHTSQYAPR